MDELKKALAAESKAFGEAYQWLEEHMPPSFHRHTDVDTRILITRNLLSYSLQNYFTPIHFTDKIIVLSPDGPDADLKIFERYKTYAIRNYRAFVSNAPAPGEKTGTVRISILYFRDPTENEPIERKRELFDLAKKQNPELKEEEIETLLASLTPNFLKSMPEERLLLSLSLFFRAKTRDQCQYEFRQNPGWEKKEAPSFQLVLAWKNVPKVGFFYQLAKVIREHNLALQKVVGITIDISDAESILILSLGLHGIKGKAAWEEANIDEFLREFVLVKYFNTDDKIATTFNTLLTGNERHMVRNFASFVHQVLLYDDPYLYSFENVNEGLCRHPELTVQLCKLFAAKFDKPDLSFYDKLKNELLQLIDKLDTGQAVNDLRRKNILKQTIHFIDFTLKTNFYRNNKTGFSFRLDPKYLDHVPFDRKEKFPELPYGIFFIRGLHYIGFNIRFKDLARGGVRTVLPQKMENYLLERNHIFAEAYNLAYTQQKKNKDIPEGGAKTAILLEPLDASLQEAQRSFIECLMTLVNCDENGTLKAKSVIDYWKRPEYIYLGPDENMFNDMIVWIANYAVQNNYKPGRSFMSSKPGAGINHKEFGVTSFGVNVYLHQTLLFLGIDPEKKPFTVKISGGPDGDVAGNEILNLYKYYPKTAKLLALTDVSGTIYDPEGLDLAEMANLFHKSLPIRNYPPEKLHEGGFLLDLKTKREESALSQQTLLWRKKNGKAIQEWISGNEMNHLFRTNVHQVVADVFIPGGGRPRTLNESNYTSYLDETGKPTSKAIVEGANLYLTPAARRALENLGVLIIKDSSCNKGGVICSSFEVLASLCMTEEQFLKEKTEYVKQVLDLIGKAALHEARLLLDTHQKTGAYLTDISDKISEKINLFKYQLLDHFETLDIASEPTLLKCLVQYCPPLLRSRYKSQILAMPDIHKKAIVACYLASHLVYRRGLDWTPTIADVLPAIASDPEITGE
jgi:glutamate dehydrogenase